MCSFLVTSINVDQQKFDDANKTQVNRGPDFTNQRLINGITFIHNLLSITGEFTKQPFLSNGIASIFNGEIYNFNELGDYESDGYAIIPSYKNFGSNFSSHLDGEFAICVVDYEKNLLIITTDTFGTKPVWLGLSEKDFGVASYESALKKIGFLQIAKIGPNTNVVIDLTTNKVLNVSPVTTFDLKQHKLNFDDWMLAFERSITKRAANTKEKLFIGLSSGYDSGAIACELIKQNIEFNAYTLEAAEDIKILERRQNLVKNSKTIPMSKKKYEDQVRFLSNNAEQFSTPPRPGRPNGYVVLNDKGAIGTGIVCEEAKKDGCKIYLSGQGSDEIMSDYGHMGIPAPGFLHCTIAGYYPEDLTQIFPWTNFFKGTQEEFLYKDESVAGSYGIESRYPFLDKDLVQEFLWLDNRLKNKDYKSPLYHYLTKFNFPFVSGLQGKVGFRANSNLR